jgi:hypothetical protein
LTISHHPRLESRIAEARAKLGIIAARFDKFDDELHAMLAKELSVTEAGGYFRGLTGADLPHGTDRQKKTREKVFGQMLDNFDNERNTLPGVKHTAWGAYNAVSEWADHQRKYRGGRPPTSWTGSWIQFGSVSPTNSNRQRIAARLNWRACLRRPLPEPVPVQEEPGRAGERLSM